MIVLHSFTLAEHYCVGHTMLSLERKGSDKEKKINHVSNVLIVTAQVVQRLMNKFYCLCYEVFVRAAACCAAQLAQQQAAMKFFTTSKKKILCFQVLPDTMDC